MKNAWAEDVVLGSFWGQWKSRHDKGMHVNSCDFAGFTSKSDKLAKCRSQGDLKTKSKDQYRVYCATDMLPKSIMSLDIAAPLNPRADDDAFQLYFSIGQAF